MLCEIHLNALLNQNSVLILYRSVTLLPFRCQINKPLFRPQLPRIEGWKVKLHSNLDLGCICFKLSDSPTFPCSIVCSCNFLFFTLASGITRFATGFNYSRMIKVFEGNCANCVV